MRYRRSGQRRSGPDRSYARRVGFETAKEGGGNLVQQAGAALGALVGLLGGKAGLPPSASVITGAIVGSALGSIGKGFVAASLDHIRERREQRATRTSAGAGAGRSWRHVGAGGRSGAGGSNGRGGRGSGSGGASSTAAPLPRVSTSTSIAGQVIGGLDTVMSQLNRASRRLAEIHRAMWDAQNALNAVLAGGRPDVVLTLEGQLSTARGHVHDATGQLAGAADNLATYRSAI
ncbi:hypothetical protein [Micromonospora yangpuensis]|uniref:Uncharacterized protein n=1 Tax=Micromonospora yangpuensis TaxID=683228 RepID=A0A1C6V2J3_9ACTN|nr:hypothetical protein [Micromonospora yangpuensis]GGM32459.1 hypothetical protein GCM10012279_59250 [Micromonospora yangpuensis]SCL60579.1 hypothetical protein GA0070617_4419 [Micromonospora yangpuensis]